MRFASHSSCERTHEIYGSVEAIGRRGSNPCSAVIARAESSTVRVIGAFIEEAGGSEGVWPGHERRRACRWLEPDHPAPSGGMRIDPPPSCARQRDHSGCHGCHGCHGCRASAGRASRIAIQTEGVSCRADGVIVRGTSKTECGAVGLSDDRYCRLPLHGPGMCSTLRSGNFSVRFAPRIAGQPGLNPEQVLHGARHAGKDANVFACTIRDSRCRAR